MTKLKESLGDLRLEQYAGAFNPNRIVPKGPLVDWNQLAVR
jgi:hypothetical protein